MTIPSQGWQLVGDWRAPEIGQAWPAALLLHRAAGTRDEYVGLAEELAAHGIASLRLDLRAHGESATLGRFQEPWAENLHLLDGSHLDVSAALDWLRARRDVAGERLGVVGASYSGEAIGESLRSGGATARAYVLLSPGSFSEESIAEVDRSGAAWLFVRTTGEDEVSKPFIDAVFAALEAGSRTAELRVVAGEGHATGIFDTQPRVAEEVAGWLADQLQRADMRREASAGQP